MAIGDVIVVEVDVDPGLLIVRVAGADAESLLVAYSVSVVETNALSPVQAHGTATAACAAVDVGGRFVVLCDRPVNRVL